WCGTPCARPRTCPCTPRWRALFLRRCDVVPVLSGKFHIVGTAVRPRGVVVLRGPYPVCILGIYVGQAWSARAAGARADVWLPAARRAGKGLRGHLVVAPRAGLH